MTLRESREPVGCRPPPISHIGGRWGWPMFRRRPISEMMIVIDICLCLERDLVPARAAVRRRLGGGARAADGAAGRAREGAARRHRAPRRAHAPPRPG